MPAWEGDAAVLFGTRATINKNTELKVTNEGRFERFTAEAAFQVCPNASGNM